MAMKFIFDDFIAGWTSGVAGLLVSHPLDTVKVRLQSLDNYKGVLQCISQTMRQESIRGFYKGMAAPLLTAGFLHSTYFLGNSATLAAIEKLSKTGMNERNREQQRKENPLEILLLASAAGAILQWIPSCPIEIVKTKLQVQQESLHQRRQLSTPNMVNKMPRIIFSGPIDCIRQTLRLVGLRGFYKGGLTMFLRDVIGYWFYLPVYELMLRYLSKDESHRRIWHPMLAGGIAGVACWWSILPLDVVKSRLQADDLMKPKYRGLAHCVSETYRKEGWQAFTKGWHVVAIRGFPACACLFFVYEQTLQFLKR